MTAAAATSGAQAVNSLPLIFFMADLLIEKRVKRSFSVGWQVRVNVDQENTVIQN
jgi:hypothetical protein